MDEWELNAKTCFGVMGPNSPSKGPLLYLESVMQWLSSKLNLIRRGVVRIHLCAHFVILRKSPVTTSCLIVILVIRYGIPAMVGWVRV